MTEAMRALSRAITTLILEEPFYGHLLGEVARREDPAVATACLSVGADGATLIVAPDFFLALSPSERVAVVKHEALHLVLQHVARRRSRDHRWLFNVAADLVVNQFLGPWDPPPDLVTLESVQRGCPGLRLSRDEPVGAYYDELAGYLAERLGDARWRWLERLGSDAGHDAWSASTEATVAVDRAVARAWSRTGLATRGSLPDQVREAIRSRIGAGAARVDWRRQLRMFCGRHGRSRLRSTVRRPSKRYGTFPGLRSKRTARLLVAVDTSGSIGDEELSDFFAEISALWRRGAEIDVMEVDAQVQRVWPYRGTPPTSVVGRGGTCFEPVFRWLCEPGRRYDGLVYLTDGFAPRPQTRPRCPVLWVVCAHGDCSNLPFGPTIRLRTDRPRG